MSEVKSKAASVTFDGVTKSFGAVTAVDAISFNVEQGQLVTLLEDESLWEYAVFALGRIGPAAKEAVPALEVKAREGARGAEFALFCIRGEH